MKKATLGNGLDVSRLGLGCMGMSAFYSGAGHGRRRVDRTIHRAIDLGITFFDTAEIYGPYINEELLGRATQAHRGTRSSIATKFGTLLHRGDAQPRPGRQPRERASCRSRARSAAGHRLHRPLLPAPDGPQTSRSRTPSVRSPSSSREGKIRHYGLSEAAPATIRRAHAVHPVTALQTEYSLWSRDPEDESCRGPRARHRLRALFAARPRLPHRHDPQRRPARRRTTSGGTTRGSRAKPAANIGIVEQVDAVASDRAQARPGRTRLAAGPGRRHRAHPRDARIAPARGELAADGLTLTTTARRRSRRRCPQGDRSADMSRS